MLTLFSHFQILLVLQDWYEPWGHCQVNLNFKCDNNYIFYYNNCNLNFKCDNNYICLNVYLVLVVDSHQFLFVFWSSFDILSSQGWTGCTCRKSCFQLNFTQTLSTLVNNFSFTSVTNFNFVNVLISCIPDHGGSHKLCVMEVVKGADETLAPDQRWIKITNVALFVCQRHTWANLKNQRYKTSPFLKTNPNIKQYKNSAIFGCKNNAQHLRKKHSHLKL